MQRFIDGCGVAFGDYRAKWRTDRAETDWVRLALLHGRFLPDLIPSRATLELYSRNTLRR